MEGKLYLVYDRMADEHGPVFQSRNDGTALRTFTSMLKDTTYPEDFELLCVASIDKSGNVVENKYNVEKQNIELVEV